MTKELAKVGKSDKGQQAIINILDAAESVLIDEGYHNFTLRKVAASAGLTIGNLQYYYSTKDSLIAAMLDNAVERYLERFGEVRASAGPDPENQFIELVSMIIRDLNQRSTTMFFGEPCEDAARPVSPEQWDAALLKRPCQFARDTAELVQAHSLVDFDEERCDPVA